MDPFVYKIGQKLDNDTCNNIINRFEQDTRKYDGVVNKVKLNQELQITSFDDWKDIDNILYASLQQGMETYLSHLDKELQGKIRLFNKVTDKGYIVEKYSMNLGFKHWHHDFGFYNDVKEKPEVRIIAFRWALVPCTIEFLNKDALNLEQGDLLFYPATWTYNYNIPKCSCDQYFVIGYFVV